MATYQVLYEQALEQATGAGGTSEEMDAIVDELNAIGSGRYRPSARYKAWLKTLTTACDVCGDTFEPEGIPEIKSDALCARCQTRKDEEGVPEPVA